MRRWQVIYIYEIHVFFLTQKKGKKWVSIPKRVFFGGPEKSQISWKIGPRTVWTPKFTKISWISGKHSVNTRNFHFLEFSHFFQNLLKLLRKCTEKPGNFNFARFFEFSQFCTLVRTRLLARNHGVHTRKFPKITTFLHDPDFRVDREFVKTPIFHFFLTLK